MLSPADPPTSGMSPSPSWSACANCSSWPKSPSTSRKAKELCASACGASASSRRRRPLANATPSGMLNSWRSSRCPTTAAPADAAKLTPVRLPSRHPIGPISPAVVQPTTGAPPNRAPISLASAPRSYSLEQKKSTSDVSVCARPRCSSSAAARGSAAQDCAMRMVRSSPIGCPRRPAHGCGPVHTSGPHDTAVSRPCECAPAPAAGRAASGLRHIRPATTSANATATWLAANTPGRVSV